MGVTSEAHHQEDPIVIQNSGWANLPAELLRNVIKRLEESECTWPSRKHVVACAAVCTSWRKMCKDSVKSLAFSAKHTFPVSLKQPGPKDGTIQCFIKRDKSNHTYQLFLSLSPGLLVEDGKFLLSAKRTWRTTYTEYVISMDPDNISRSSTTYIGKIRSNFLRSKFTIYDSAPADQILSQRHESRSRLFNSKKVSPKGPTGNYNIAQVTYEVNFPGPRGPRRMHCIMHSIPTLALQPDSTVVPGQPELLQGGSFDESNAGALMVPLMDHSVKEQPLVLRNKAPRWHQQIQCWCLNFRGRVTVSSVKNFQLMAAAAAVQPGSATVQPPSSGVEALTKAASVKQPGQADDGEILLQFGKVGQDIFNMDYRYPLSAFQAFAISLTSFDTKLACE